ncbi:MAG: hypothetical protein RSN88_07265 [Gordonibacter sp.]|uniref:hypothetical protein n=1 Tax=Gordonibacter sp. TaxID=1968902 RepID=UPI002FC5B02D
MSAIICPFCGRESASQDYCTKCRTRFTKEVRAIAYPAEDDPRSDRIGPFSTRTAKYLGWVLLVLLLVAFVLATELTGNGLSGSGLR